MWKVAIASGLIVLACFVGSASAQSSFEISPYAGYIAQSDRSEVYADDTLFFSFRGNSLVGIDVGILPLIADYGLVLSGMALGLLTDDRRDFVEVSGSRLGIGVQRQFRLGAGKIELSGSYIYRLDETKIYDNSVPSVEFSRDSSGFLGGVRVSAPLSRAIDLAIVSKVEIASSWNTEAVTEYGETIAFYQSGTAFVVAAGFNWRP